MNLGKELLNNFYTKEKLSALDIAKKFNCSENKINYWLNKYKIPKRSISEAVYIKHNKDGDPFKIQQLTNTESAFLYGLGLGLYWGEGNKKNKNSVRLGNTDPKLIKKFIEFLEKTFLVDKNKFKFGLQIFGDLDDLKVRKFWINYLELKESQFQKTVITPHRGIGNYKEKSKYGVLTVYFNNTKLQKLLLEKIENL